MLEKLKNVTKRIFKLQIYNKKYSSYIIFFLISFFFWFLTMLSGTHEATLKLPVSYKNYPPDLVLTSNPDNYINIRVRSPGFGIIFYNLFSSKKLPLDISFANLKNLTKGQEVFWLMNSKRKNIIEILGSDMEIMNINPQRIALAFKYKAKKNVPIILQDDISLEPQFWFSKPIELEPDSITIYGEEKQLDTINFVLAQPFHLINLNRNKKLRIDLEKIKGIEYKVEGTDIMIFVEPFIEERIMKKVRIKNLKNKYSLKLFPESVEVTIRVPKNKYTVLKTDFFNIDVDMNLISKNTKMIELKTSNLPSYAKVQRIYPDMLEYLLIKE